MIPAVLIGTFGWLLANLYGTLAPYRDSGDLAAAALSLGIAHPPGYALYVLATRAAMALLPFGNPAYQANVLSSLWTAAAAGLLVWALSRRVRPVAAFFGAAVWLFSPAVLRLSLVSEMYTLNGFLAAVILAVVLESGPAGAKERTRFVYLAFFLLGLGLLNQPTIVFLLPGLLWFAWDASGPDRGEKARTLAACAFFGSLGFTLVAYYPVRSFRQPVLDWGDPESFRRVFRLITRADYGGLKLHPEESRLAWTLPGFVSQAGIYFRALYGELRVWGVLAAAAGLFVPARRRGSGKSRELVFCGAGYLLASPVFILLSNLPAASETSLPILEPYFVMAHLLTVPWMAAGFNEGLGWLEKRVPRRAVPALGWSAVVLAALFTRFKSARRDFSAYDYGKNVLKTMPKDSSLYDPDDTTAFVVSYLQTAGGLRRDVVPLMTLRTFWGYRQIRERHPELAPPGEFRSAPEFISALLARHAGTGRPLYSDHPSKFPAGLPNGPAGLLSRAGNARSLKDFRESQEIFRFYVERGTGRDLAVDHSDGFFTRHLRSRASSALNNIGIVEQNHKEYGRAEAYFRAALLRQPDLTQAWNNLGLNEFLQGRYLRAAEIFRQGAAHAADRGTLLYYLALCQRRMEQPSLARKTLEEVLHVHPGNAGAMNEMGLAYLDENNWITAEKWFRKCIEADPSYVPAHFNLGLALRALGLAEEAADSFREYLELSPGAEDSAKVRGWIRVLSKRRP